MRGAARTGGCCWKKPGVRQISMLAVVVAVALLAGCKSSGLRYSILYLDLDGTALDSNHDIRPATLEAVGEFRASGGEVGIATGRVFEQAEKAIGRLKPTLPVVLFNGAVLFYPGARRMAVLCSLDPGAVRQVEEALKNAGYADGYIIHHAERSVGRPIKSPDRLLRFAKEAGISLPSTGTGTDASGKEPPVIKVLVVCEEGHVEDVATPLKKTVGAVAKVVISSKRTVEVLPPGVDKARAIRRALGEKAGDLSQVAAFGDSGNDVEMIREVGLGIAMGNARPETRSVAVATIGSNDTDAIAVFIRKVLLPAKVAPAAR